MPPVPHRGHHRALGRDGPGHGPLSLRRCRQQRSDADPPLLVGPAAGALALVGAGAWALWQGWNANPAQDNPESDWGHWLWYASGAGLTVLGVWIFVRN